MKTFHRFLDQIQHIVEKLNEGRITHKTTAEEFTECVKRSVKVNIQNVADYFYGPLDQDFSEKTTPNIMPPWDYFWMEYNLPTSILNKGYCGHYGGLHSKSMEADGIFLNSLHSLFNSDFSNVLVGQSSFKIGRDGSMLDMYGNESEKRYNLAVVSLDKNNLVSDDIRKAQSEYLDNVLRPVLLAICFCHCKNVEVVKNPIEPELRKAWAKKGRFPVDKFYTLSISPIKRILSEAMKSNQCGGAKALHICRGHFKDFRNHGLFGKHKGMFWWDMNLRGSSKYGTIKKDYQIKTRI